MGWFLFAFFLKNPVWLVCYLCTWFSCTCVLGEFGWVSFFLGIILSNAPHVEHWIV